jgi:hypothetical protein
MDRDISTYTVEEVVSALQDPAHHHTCKAALLKTEALPEEILGLRDFMEQHNWNSEALNAFLSPAPDLFEQLQNRKRQNRMGSWPLKVAAVLVPLLGISWFIWQQNNTTTANLYATYYAAEPGLPVTMSLKGNVDFANAMSAFKDRQWQEAEKGFATLLNQESDNDTLQYFIGCVQLELQDGANAILQLSEVDSASAFYKKARYRLLLAHLQMGNVELARSLALTIVDDSTDVHATKAALLLREPTFSDR